MLVIAVISGYSSTFLLIGSKIYTPDDGVPGIGDPTRGTTTVVPRVGSPVRRHPAYEQVERPPLLEPVGG